ncbi:MAG: T9SS type A sorting domain-containing protein [Saprospiraceae bacterium]|nr:T9SS type A sorting domain-containing protein [Saprospiraceae bacterium]
MKTVLLIFFAFFNSAIVLACSCAGPDTFCRSIQKDNIVVTARMGIELESTIFEFFIVESLYNDITESRIVLQSQTGFSCDAYLNQYAYGDTVILNLDPILNPAPDDTIHYRVTFCGVNHLRYLGGYVLGAISEGVEQLAFSSFKSLVLECQRQNEVLNNQLEITLNPNPVDNLLTIRARNQDIVKVQLFDISGREMDLYYNSDYTTLKEIPFSHYPAGVYFIKIVASLEERVFKVVKS